VGNLTGLMDGSMIIGQAQSDWESIYYVTHFTNRADVWAGKSKVRHAASFAQTFQHGLLS